MDKHNCLVCGFKGDCPIEPIAPWVEEHDHEITEAWDSSIDQNVQVGNILIQQYPSFAIGWVDIGKAIQFAFILGYYKATTRTEIPQVFSK